MKKLLLSLFFMSAVSVSMIAKDVVLTPASADDETTMTKDGVTVTFDQSTGSTAPKWYSPEVRTYKDNKTTISSTTTIEKIVFVYSTSNNGCFISDPEGWTESTKTWEGEAKSVVFTTSQTGNKNGQVRISKITVTLQDDKTTLGDIVLKCDGEVFTDKTPLYIGEKYNFELSAANAESYELVFGEDVPYTEADGKVTFSLSADNMLKVTATLGEDSNTEEYEFNFVEKPEVYDYSFNATPSELNTNTDPGTYAIKLGDIDWTFSFEGPEGCKIQSFDNNRGFHVGSNKKSPTAVSFSTEAFEGYDLTEISITANDQNDTNVTFEVGNTVLKEESFKSTDQNDHKTVTWNGKELDSNPLTISFDIASTVQQSFYIKAINVKYNIPETPEELNDSHMRMFVNNVEVGDEAVEINDGDVLKFRTVPGLDLYYKISVADAATTAHKAAAIDLEAEGYTKHTGHIFTYTVPEDLAGHTQVKAVAVHPTTGAQVTNSLELATDGTVTGVEQIAVDNEAANAVYFNLSGARIDAPANGLYIKVVDGKASKVLVK